MRRTLPTVAVVLALFVLAVLPAASPVSAQSQTQGFSSQITVTATISPVYDAFGSSSGSVVATAAVSSLITVQATPVELLSNFPPSSVAATAIVGGVNTTIPVVVSSGKYGSDYGYDMTLPGNTTSLEVKIEGTNSGSAFLWRYIINDPFVIWNGVFAFTSYTTSLTVPSGSIIQSVYGSAGESLPASLRNSQLKLGHRDRVHRKRRSEDDDYPIYTLRPRNGRDHPNSRRSSSPCVSTILPLWA